MEKKRGDWKGTMLEKASEKDGTGLEPKHRWYLIVRGKDGRCFLRVDSMSNSRKIRRNMTGEG